MQNRLVEWPARNKLVAALVGRGASVIDLGAGHEALRKRLVEPTRYVPVDLEPTTAEAVHADFDAGIYPELEPADCVVAQGVLEHLIDPEDFLRRAHAYGPRLLVTYFATRNTNQDRVNFFTRKDVEAMLVAAQWRVVNTVTVGPQLIFDARACGFSDDDGGGARGTAPRR